VGSISQSKIGRVSQIFHENFKQPELFRGGKKSVVACMLAPKRNEKKVGTHNFSPNRMIYEIQYPFKVEQAYFSCSRNNSILEFTSEKMYYALDLGNRFLKACTSNHSKSKLFYHTLANVLCSAPKQTTTA